MHYFITGHTGFKGSWLILLLKELGHQVSGYSLEPAPGGLFELASLDKDLSHHFIGDIRDLGLLKTALAVSSPDFAIHLAAQPLVLRSYEDPIETYTTNVDGTRNFLEAISSLPKPPVSLVVTTDKVYRDEGKGSYKESDPLGGHDPYSASKAMADILTMSWANTNPGIKLHVARAGNVIGAYDVSANRLIPDYIRAFRGSKVLEVRHPEAVRPWQHVLDCLTGYLRLLSYAQTQEKAPLALNFGPDPDSSRTVEEVLEVALGSFPISVSLGRLESLQKKETGLLSLDSSSAKRILSWRNKVPFENSIEWSLAELNDIKPRDLVESQIRTFLRID